jgi:hypothetical protein
VEQAPGVEFRLGMENVAVVLETCMWLSLDFFPRLLLLLLERCCFCGGFVLDSAGRVCVAGVAMRAE